MVKWRKPLYLDEQMKIQKKRSKVIKAVDKKKPCLPSAYGIALADAQEDLLSIFLLNELLLPFHIDREVKIVGLADGRDSALALVRDIIEEIYRNTGGVPVKQYLDF